MAPRDLDRLARAVRLRRDELGIPLNDNVRKYGIVRTTWARVESGERIRDSNYAKIDKALRWATGGCIAIAEGGDPIEITSSEGNDVIEATVPHGKLIAEARQAVVNASMLTLTDTPANEIRALSDRVVEELQDRGIIPKDQ